MEGLSGSDGPCPPPPPGRRWGRRDRDFGKNPVDVNRVLQILDRPLAKVLEPGIHFVSDLLEYAS